MWQVTREVSVPVGPDQLVLVGGSVLSDEELSRLPAGTLRSLKRMNVLVHVESDDVPAPLPPTPPPPPTPLPDLPLDEEPEPAPVEPEPEPAPPAWQSTLAADLSVDAATKEAFATAGLVTVADVLAYGEANNGLQQGLGITANRERKVQAAITALADGVPQPAVEPEPEPEAPAEPAPPADVPVDVPAEPATPSEPQIVQSRRKRR